MAPDSTARIELGSGSTSDEIQAAIDRIATDGGGTVALAAGSWELDRPIALRSRVRLVGAGADTVLRRPPTRVYELTGYHNYGQHDVPLRSTTGLRPGMGVSIRDDRSGGFGGTAATITWVEDGWVGLDRPLEADYQADANPRLLTGCALVEGIGIADAELADLRLDGAAFAADEELNSCRIAAAYLARSRDVTLRGIEQHGFAGEGFGFQLCAGISAEDSRFDGNHGNGLHPGAGSTNVRFERCRCEGNGRAGLFFCVRATLITAADCRFADNGIGISIGTRDCFNRIVACAISGNRGPGVQVRTAPRPIEVHSCLFEDCAIACNGRDPRQAQVDIRGDAHDLWFRRCRVEGGCGFALVEGAQAVGLHEVTFKGCGPPTNSIAAQPPEALEFGYQGPLPITDRRFRHLGLG